jgi:hypothetical protein
VEQDDPMREHDRIVDDLKEKIKSKGIEILSSRRDAAMVVKKGFTVGGKTDVTAFIPDIVVKAGATDEDVVCIDYVHSKRQFAHDARGMMLLSTMGYLKAQSFVLILNDNLLDHSRGISENAHIHQMGLSTFKKFLQNDYKERFLAFLNF